jgi:hypothetical protein
MASALPQSVSHEANSEVRHAMANYGFPGLGGPIGNDPIDWLQEASQIAADNLRAIQQHAVDCRQLMPDTEELRALHTEKADYERRITELTRHPGHGGKGLPEDNPSVRSARKQLDKVAAEIRRHKELGEVRAARWRNAGQLARATEDWLKLGVPTGTVIQEHPAIAVSDVLKKSENVTDAVERLKHRRREFKADLHRINSARYPKADAKRKATAQIDKLAAAAEPYIDGVVEHLGEIDFQASQIVAPVHNAANAPEATAIFFVPDAIGLVCWAFRDQLLAKIFADIDQTDAGDATALSEAQRQTQSAEIGDDMLMIDRQLAALVFHGQADGLNVEHEIDADPRALHDIHEVAEHRRLQAFS